jgi:S1-C subfamily serine protease
VSTRALGVTLALAAYACGGVPRAANAPTTLTSASSCSGIGIMLDLRADLLDGVPAVGVPGYLAQLDAQVASLSLAERRLTLAGGNGNDMLPVIRALGSALDEQRKKAEPLAVDLARSYAAVNDALDEASTCRGVDLRVLEAAPHATRTERTLAALAARSPEAKAQRALNQKVADSKPCAGANRLLAATKSLDVSSKISSAAVGQHLSEMSVEGPTLAVRDKLSRALLDHSRSLEAFAAAVDPKDTTAGARTKVAVLLAQLDRQGRTCIENMTESASQVVASEKAPRQVTVLVRPKWPERYAGASTDTGVFGSGVLVRWRTPSGKTETRVVSNAHVLDGAEEAEIFDADGDKPWKARVVRISDDDDLAVLQIDDPAHSPRRGLALRLTPAKDDEAVVAAGFPGLNAQPSFQLSRGTISNATFRLGAGAFGAYVQHTAAIDPGNSGGPLLDGEGRLLGINTIKVTGRESVGFAIPAARVQVALLRADDRRHFLLGHAAAMCRAFVSAVAETAPHGSIVQHISLSLHDPDARSLGPRIVVYRDAVAPKGGGPIWDARVSAYARMRVRLEDDGGVAPLTGCTAVRELRADPSASFEGTFRTRSGQHTVRIDDEDGVLRVAAMK